MPNGSGRHGHVEQLAVLGWQRAKSVPGIGPLDGPDPYIGIYTYT
jgi:hypothetical protein